MIFRRKQPQLMPITRIRPQRNKKLRAFFWILTLAIVAIVGWIGVTGIIAFNNIQAKNDSDGPSFFKFGEGVDPNSLNEGDTRINTLLIGADNAAGLTDTIQIYSIDPINKTTAMLSVPRDLYVKNPLGGKTKINQVYNDGVKQCNISGSCDVAADAGAIALKNVLREALGINIHYFARLDFQGFQDVIDSIGGVTIYVEKPLSDPNFPCSTDPAKPCGYSQPAGTYNMSGVQALRYARCRSGNCGSDFGRAARQQQVIEAIRQKVLGLGVIANPQKITSIISDLGRHFKTDMKLDEMIKVFGLISDTDKSKVTTKVIDNSATGPLISGINGGGQYVLMPKAGADDWSGVHQFVLSAMPEPYIVKEKANIIIIDASGNKLAEEVEELLTAIGYTVIGSETAASTSADTTIWSDGDHPYTLALLKKRLSAQSNSSQPTTTTSEPDIVLVIGSNYMLK